MASSPRDTLARNRQEAQALVESVGTAKARRLLQESESALQRRVREAVKGPGDKSFTAEQAKATLAQVRAVIRELNPGLKRVMVSGAADMADQAAGGVVEYLERADMEFRGVGSQPLALDEAAVLDVAQEGAQSSILRRLASSGEPVAKADAIAHKAKQGILERYGMNVVQKFEETLQGGLIQRASFDTMKERLVSQSQFLQGAPASWAERIVRTELMGAYNKAGWEGLREADDQLGDMVKILSATFDNRTAADSYAYHGQIRRTEEAFQTWVGLMQHPPGRPNDREIVVPHRISWPIPKYLYAKTPGEILARWKHDKRKGSPPPQPLTTTIPLSEFGKPQPLKRRRGEDAEEPSSVQASTPESDE